MVTRGRPSGGDGELTGVGLVGGLIEDATGDRDRPRYDVGHAAERVATAAEAAHAPPFPFTLTAGAENLQRGNQDPGDTIRRLPAFAKVGTDVLCAPGPRDPEPVRAVCAALSALLDAVREAKDRGPVGHRDRSLTTPELNAFMAACPDPSAGAGCGGHGVPRVLTISGGALSPSFRRARTTPKPPGGLTPDCSHRRA